MQLLSIDQLKPGQIVATAVTNAGGAILCPVGFELTDAAIGRLRNAGVDAVIVESREEANDTIEERLEQLRRRFQKVEDPIMLQLKAAIENRLNFMKL